MTPFPPLRRPSVPWEADWPENRWDLADRQVGKLPAGVATQTPASGERAALTVLRRFLARRLSRYDAGRNDPNAAVQSLLSPYIHFGQISAQRVALEAATADADAASRDAFLEQLIIRRELAENFCHYNRDYDCYEGFPAWARRTLEDHASDARPALYSLEQLAAGETDDPLWNAAQRQMVLTGTMPGYLRMFWAKRILEWTATPEEALSAAIELNDTYQLDGRDPNGYTGIAWSLGGVHDRPWFERPIFGKIRYMNANGCARKFDVPRYIAAVERLENRR